MPTRQTTPRAAGGTVAGMVTKIGQKRRARLYITEWFEYCGVNDEKVGNRIGVDRTTVWKWRDQPSRLDPDKLAAIADALDIEPAALWRMPPPKDQPPKPSVDEMLRDAPPDIQDTVIELARRLVNRAS